MKKKLLKRIGQVANQLPDMDYTAYSKEYVDHKDELGNVVGHMPKMIHTSKSKHRINHTRRIKRLAEKHGFEDAVKIHVGWCEKATGRKFKIDANV